MELSGGDLRRHAGQVDEQRAYAQITEMDRRIRARSDRWHAAYWLIIGLCASGLLLAQHSWPEFGWRWTAAYFLIGSVVLGMHLWRRSVHRTPPRWHAAVWPITWILLLAAAAVLDLVMAPGLSLPALAVAATPTLPGLAAMAWTLRR